MKRVIRLALAAVVVLSMVIAPVADVVLAFPGNSGNGGNSGSGNGGGNGNGNGNGGAGAAGNGAGGVGGGQGNGFVALGGPSWQS